MAEAATKRLLISGGTVLAPRAALQGHDILIGEGRILQIAPAGQIGDFSERIEAAGRVVAPGLIDLHVQGAGGADVLDGEPAAIDTISRTCARFGVSAFLATTVYRQGGDNRHLRVAAEACGRNPPGAAILGIHLEGPYIAPEKRGMIQPDCLAEVEAATQERILELCGGRLRMMTIAPELPGALDMVRRLNGSGVVPAFGHSQADYQQTKAGIAAGIAHVTHLYNAMRSMHHRDPGPLPAIFEAPQVSVQIIPDGVHVHPAVLRLAARALGPRRPVLISDGMQAMGLPDGSYQYNGLTYRSKDGTARYLDGTLIGTSLGLSRLVERFVSFTGCDLLGAIQAASTNPARVLGLEGRKGSLEPGKDADLVLLRPDYSVEMTFRDGRCIYRDESG